MTKDPSQTNTAINNELAGTTGWVTGSSSGIGQAIAIELARRGADVVIHGRSASPKLESVRREIESLGRRTLILPADFAQTPDFDSLADNAWKWQGKLDFLVNNAGADVLTGNWCDRPFSEKLDFLWRVDVAATLLLSKVVGGKMVEYSKDENRADSYQPTILTMGWDQAVQGMAGPSGELFSTSKGAVMAMTKSLAQSLAPHVRVNCLAPGWIKTKWGEDTSDYWSQRAKGEALMGRWGTPGDVANMAAFLCSKQSSFVSGQIMRINGGFRFAAESEQQL